MFVAIEGPDGSGKTTQVEAVVDRFSEEREVELVPGCSASPIGKMIRRALAGELEVNPLEMQALYTADRIARSQALAESVARGKMLIADRWTPSAIVYGSLHLEHPDVRLAHMRWLEFINRVVCTPSLYVVLTAGATTLVERLSRRGGRVEVYERADLVPRIVEGYVVLPRVMHEAVVYVNGERPAAQVTESIVDAIREHARPKPCPF